MTWLFKLPFCNKSYLPIIFNKVHQRHRKKVMLFIATVLMMFVLQYYFSEQKDKWYKRNPIHMTSILWKVKIKRLELRSKLVKACDESKEVGHDSCKASICTADIRHGPYREHPHIRLCVFSASPVCAKNTFQTFPSQTMEC